MTFHKYIGDSKMFEYDKHFRECQQLNKPFIKARTDPKHGDYFVQIDLITCDYTLSDKEQDEMTKLVNDQIKSNPKFQGFNIDKEIAWFDGISPSNVKSFCESLYDLTQKFH